MTDWYALAERNARVQNTLIGWVFFDPGANERYAALGVSKGGYIAGRSTPLAPAGADAVVAAFYSITPVGIRAVHRLVESVTTWDAVRSARDEAVLAGLRTYVPAHVDAIASLSTWLWDAVDACPLEGKVLFGAHVALGRPEDPLLSTWYATNCLREMRGDVHWALFTVEGLSGPEVSIIHNAYVGYERDWLPRSRGNSAEEIEGAWASLAARGLVTDGEVNETGLQLREHIEVRTNELCITPWKAVGEARSQEFFDVLKEPCKTLGGRVDVTAGSNYGPGARAHDKGYGSARKRLGS